MADGDEAIQRRMGLAKQLYERGVLYSRPPTTEMRRLLSVIVLDLANEVAMNAAVGSLDTARAPKSSFHALRDQLDTLLTAVGFRGVPASVARAHGIRNDAQHKARFPSDSDAGDCRAWTRDFLSTLFTDVWDTAFESIALSDRIRNDTVRSDVKLGESELPSGNLQAAAGQAAIALGRALNRVQTAMVGGKIRESRDVYLPGIGMAGTSDKDRALKRLQTTTLYLALGLDIADLYRFRAVAGEAVFFIDGSAQTNGTKEDVTREEAEFALQYAVSSIIEIEERVGDMERPFDKTHWY